MRLYQRRFLDADGDERTASRWTLDYAAPDGRRRRITLFRDREASAEAARKITRLAERVAGGSPLSPSLRAWIAGLPLDLRNRLIAQGTLPRGASELDRPLGDLVDDFEASILDRGKTTKHASDQATGAREAFQACGFRLWRDIDAGALARHLARRRRHDRLSHRRSNAILAGARQFTRWIVASGLAPEDPLRTLRPLPVDADRRRIRRAFTEAEFARLLGLAEFAQLWAGLSRGERRELIEGLRERARRGGGR